MWGEDGLYRALGEDLRHSPWADQRQLPEGLHLYARVNLRAQHYGQLIRGPFEFAPPPPRMAESTPTEDLMSERLQPPDEGAWLTVYHTLSGHPVGRLLSSDAQRELASVVVQALGLPDHPLDDPPPYKGPDAACNAAAALAAFAPDGYRREIIELATEDDTGLLADQHHDRAEWQQAFAETERLFNDYAAVETEDRGEQVVEPYTHQGQARLRRLVPQQACPFFTEAVLYPLLGKDDARTLLARVRALTTALGVEDPNG